MEGIGLLLGKIHIIPLSLQPFLIQGPVDLKRRYDDRITWLQVINILVNEHSALSGEQIIYLIIGMVVGTFHDIAG